MRLLIIGGTVFLGRHVAETALAGSLGAGPPRCVGSPGGPTWPLAFLRSTRRTTSAGLRP